MKSLISLRTAALAMVLLSSVPMTLGDTADSAAASSATPSASEPADSTVVAIVTKKDGTLIKKITLGDVKAKAQLLPKQLINNAKFNDIFPLLLKSVATEARVTYEAEQAGIKTSPEYLKMKKQCEEGTLQKAFLDGEIDKLATQEELMKAYEEIKAAAPKGTEYNISMITLQDKQKANTILKELTKPGGITKFAEYADKESLNKIPGGNLGYIRPEELPEPLRKPVEDTPQATIYAKVIEISMPDPATPGKKVTTYNIIYVQGKRPATFPPFKAVEEELKTALSTKLAKVAIKKLDDQTTYQFFTMDGKPLDQKADAAPKEADKKTDTSGDSSGKVVAAN